MEAPRRDTPIRTARCLIRAPRQSDYARWARLRATNRDHLTRWEPQWPSDALTMDDWRRRLRAWKDGWDVDRAYVFLIFDGETAVLQGGVSLTHVRRGPARAASLGYWLGEEFQGQGLMSEAVNAVCRWSGVILGLVRVEAATVPENTRSQKVLTTCGFEREGYARAYLEINGVRRDHVLFARQVGGLANGANDGASDEASEGATDDTGARTHADR